MTSPVMTPAAPEVRPTTGGISIVIPASPESAVVARSFLREHAKLDSMRRMEADLLITELVCNAIQHSPDVEELRVEINGDQSNGVKMLLAHVGSGPIQCKRPGIGFRLLDRLSRQWGHDFSDGEVSVWFVLRKPGLSAPSDDASDVELARNLELDAATYSDALVRRHRDLAEAIARRYRGKGVAQEDLNQVAMMALHKAINRYDPAIGDLRPYAAATISGELKHYLRDSGWAVRVPRSVQERALQTSKAFEALTQEIGREPTVAELADHLDMTEEEATEGVWARLLYASRSTDKESPSTGLTLLEQMEDPNCDLHVEDRLLLEEAKACLAEREALIVDLTYNEDKTQQEIADIIGISQMHVSRLLAAALQDMREFLQSRYETTEA